MTHTESDLFTCLEYAKGDILGMRRGGNASVKVKAFSFGWHALKVSRSLQGSFLPCQIETDCRY